ncbi:hypothetical protein FIBSPDRAFT_960449 [Athelia psychrophila]|uniref:Uncharacterized protein n=1 Tax=Athelia psychrophila TaxID=1759441 RepID=A0A166CCV7_9AGAM|nr:hypothetical protein FIBSPDRAFT_960449 [Fibularhizoctonia sp. CBS 109695]
MAEEILGPELKAREYELRRNFLETGNFGFCMQHIGLGPRYDPGIGVFRVDLYIIMCRLGEQVARRKQKKARIGFGCWVEKDDTQAWFKRRFDCIIAHVRAFVKDGATYPAMIKAQDGGERAG